LPFEFFRLEVKNSKTDAGKLVIALYPSYTFLCFVATPWAINGKLLVVKEPCHNLRPPIIGESEMSV
jgi:hypothetical protein